MTVNRKRGLSPVVASVLLIALVMVLASIVFLWARGFVGEHIQKGEKPVEQSCEDVDFSLQISEVSLSNEATFEAVNTGNEPIYSFLFIKTLDGDDTKREVVVNLAPQEEKTFKIDIKINGKLPDRVVVYPSLLGSIVGQSTHSPYSCKNQGKEVDLSEIRE